MYVPWGPGYRSYPKSAEISRRYVLSVHASLFSYFWHQGAGNEAFGPVTSSNKRDKSRFKDTCSTWKWKDRKFDVSAQGLKWYEWRYVSGRHNLWLYADSSWFVGRRHRLGGFPVSTRFSAFPPPILLYNMKCIIRIASYILFHDNGSKLAALLQRGCCDRSNESNGCTRFERDA